MSAGWISCRVANRLLSCRRWAPFLTSQTQEKFCANQVFCGNSIERVFQRRTYSRSPKDIMKNVLGSLNLNKLLDKEELNDSGIHIQDSFNEEFDHKQFTVSVEGNIGCGKTTLLEYYQKSPNVESIPEPVQQWTNVKGHNALGLLYEDPIRWSFSFNMYAQLTRIQMHKKQQEKPIKMLERSLYSTQYCFVENDFRKGTLNGLEHAVISEWFDWLLKSQQIQLDLIVYLRADPEVCYERIKQRAREEESCVPFELIEELHNLHEDWLIQESSFKSPAPVLVVDANNDYNIMKDIYEERRSDILCGYC